MGAQCVPRTPANGALGYKSRGNTEKDSRCEGLVPYSIAKLPGMYVSVTVGKVLYHRRANETIEILTPKLNSSSEILLRGRADSELGLEYYLDCKLKSNSKKTIPVEDVINVGKVDSKKYGVYGLLENDSTKLIPVAFRSKLTSASASPSDTLYIRFKPDGTFRDIKYSIRKKGQQEVVFASNLLGVFDSKNLIEMPIPLVSLGLKKGEEAEFEFAFSTTQNGSKIKDNYYSLKTLLICNEFTFK
jgi:hypothetical protein